MAPCGTRASNATQNICPNGERLQTSSLKGRSKDEWLVLGGWWVMAPGCLVRLGCCTDWGTSGLPGTGSDPGPLKHWGTQNILISHSDTGSSVLQSVNITAFSFHMLIPFHYWNKQCATVVWTHEQSYETPAELEEQQGELLLLWLRLLKY